MARTISGINLNTTPPVTYTVRMPIHQRPTSIEKRVEFSYGDGDTVLGAKTSQYSIFTETERITCSLIAIKLHDLGAATTAATIFTLLATLLAEAVRPVIFDNSTENTRLATRPASAARPEAYWVLFLVGFAGSGCCPWFLVLMIVGVFGFCGGGHAEARMEALVVPPPDPFQGG